MKQSEMVALLDAFEETTFDAGADVIAQGAEGNDKFYVVKAGALSVAKDGTQIATRQRRLATTSANGPS